MYNKNNKFFLMYLIATINDDKGNDFGLFYQKATASAADVCIYLVESYCDPK